MVNIIDGMATVPSWFLSRMMAPTAITTWKGFLMLVTNHYNFRQASGALLGTGMSGGSNTPKQAYQRGPTAKPRVTTTPVVKQQAPQVKQE